MAIEDEEAGKMSCNFKFQFPGTAEEAVFRQAHVKVVKSFDEVAEIMKSDIPLQDESNKVANTMKVRHEGSWTRLDILIFGLTLDHLEDDGHLKLTSG